MLNKNIEDDFYKLIPLLRNKDKRVYDPKAKFFDHADEAEESASDDSEASAEVSNDKSKSKKGKKAKPLHLSDYLRNRLLAKGPEAAAESDSDEAQDQPIKVPHACTRTRTSARTRPSPVSPKAALPLDEVVCGRMRRVFLQRDRLCARLCRHTAKHSGA